MQSAHQQHRPTHSASSSTSATSATSSASAAYLLQHLGSVPASAASPRGLNIYAQQPQGPGVPAAPQQQQQQQQQQQRYRVVVPQQHDSQVMQYSPGMASALPMPPKPALALNSVPRLSMSDRERQIKRRTKTGTIPQ